MSAPIRILLVEDRVEDAELLLNDLRHSGLAIESHWVDTPQALQRALDEFTPDLILSDYSMPAFGSGGGMQLLAMARARMPEVPFIFVSGTIGEDRAIEALRRGAADYVLKNHRARLVPAVARAMAGVRERRERMSAERARDETERRFRLFMEHFPGCAYMKDVEGRFTYVNHGIEEALGKPASELIGATLDGIVPDAVAREAQASHQAVVASGQTQSRLFELQTPNGWRSFLVHRFAVPDASGSSLLVGGIATDMTQQLAAERSLASSEERFRSIAEATQEWIWEMDREGVYTFCSPAAEAITGYAPDALVGRSSLELIYARARVGVGRELQLAVAEKRGWRGLVLRLQHRNGATLWLDSNGFPLFCKDGEVVGFRGAARDITQRILQERRIARLSRIHAVLSEINSAIIRVSDRTELFHDACRIAGEHGGFPLAWVGLISGPTHQVQPLVWHGDDDGYMAELAARPGGRVEEDLIRQALADRHTVVVNDIQNDPQVKSGAAALERGYRSMLAMPLLCEQAPVGVMMLYAAGTGFFTGDELKLLDNLGADISFALDHLAKDEQLAFVSYYDVLTELPNRQLFFERLGQMAQTTRSDDTPLALLVIDIDRFGFINDSMGRGAGDALLVEFARRLRESFSGSATPARISGGRFAVVIEGLEGALLARHVQERLLQTLAAPVQLAGVLLHVTAKVGIALFPQDGEQAERLFMNAEAAVQRAKETAEKLVFYASELNARVAQRLHLESRMREALERKQFVLHYQPKFNLQSRQIAGVEALIRWLDPERGLIPPLDFIPLLEETGLIVEVGRWVIEQSSADIRAWRAAGLEPPRVAVNVSQAQLRQPDFVATVLTAIGAAPGDDGGIDLEVTESLVMTEGAVHIDKLRELRAAGLRIHMDDFGTGYSSLGQIVRLPLDFLKVDRSFISGMADGNEHMAIVSMVVGLALTLKLHVIAEGVETESQARMLASLGCEQGQGWLFSRPVPAPALAELLRAERIAEPAAASPLHACPAAGAAA